jgi:DNA-binding transcriptional ArsR family regulator
MLPFGYILTRNQDVPMPAVTPYKAIADDTRRHILDLLRRETLTAGAIAERFGGMSRPAVSKHLAILRRSRLVLAKKRGRERVYALNAAPLREVNRWLVQYQQFWDNQLESFKNYVESNTLPEAHDDAES